MEQIGNSVTFYAHFVAAQVGATGLTVTIDVYKTTQAGTTTQIVTGGSATEVGGGLYKYLLASGSVDAAGEYVAVFKTTGTADQKHIPALWVVGRGGDENLDATISSRNATTPPTAAANATAVRSELATELARVDVATSTRLAAADYTAPPAAGPSAAVIAAAVVAESVAGSATGTVGGALLGIAGATVTVVSPVAADGTAISLTYGDDYYAADNRALTFADLGGPALTGGTVALRVQGATGVVSLAGVVTGAHACTVQVTSVQVASIGVGVWTYDLEATMVTTAHVVTLVAGFVTVTADVR